MYIVNVVCFTTSTNTNLKHEYDDWLMKCMYSSNKGVPRDNVSKIARSRLFPNRYTGINVGKQFNLVSDAKH